MLGKRSIGRSVVGVVFGSCLYRFIVAIAMRLHMPAAALKLVSAIIVGVAIAAPAVKQKIALEKRHRAAKAARAAALKGGDAV